MKYLREAVKHDAETRRKAGEALERLHLITQRLEAAVDEAEDMFHNGE